MKIFIGIIYIIICVFIMAVVLKQEGKQQGLGAIGGGNSDTYWSKNKGRSREGILKKMTVIAAVGFILLSIALNYMFRPADTVLPETTQEIDIEDLNSVIEGAVEGEEAEAEETQTEAATDTETTQETAEEETEETQTQAE